MNFPPIPTWQAAHPIIVHLPLGLLFVAPLLGLLGCGGAAWLLNDNRAFLAGGHALWVDYLQIAVLLFFLVGVVVALYYKSSDPARYDAIGRFVHEDVPSA